MGGLPTIKLELDDGTGTFPYDLSARFNRSQAYTIRVGKADRFGAVEARQLDVTLRNTDGACTPTTGAYGLRLGQAIRVTHTVAGVASRRFTGKISQAPMSWSGPRLPWVRITALDARPDLERTPLRDALTSEIAGLPGVGFLYPLGEAAGSTQGVSVAGTLGPKMVLYGSGAAFGVAGPPGAEGATAAFVSSSVAGYLAASESGVFPAAPGLTLMFAASGAFNVQLGSSGGGPVYLPQRNATVIAGGGVAMYSKLADGSTATPAAASPTSDTDWHLWAFRYDGATVDIVRDGVVIASTAAAGGIGTPTRLVGVNVADAVSHLSYLPRVATLTELTRCAQAARLTYADSTDQRVARLARWAGLTSTQETGAVTLTAAQPARGNNVTDLLNAVDATEGGLTFLDASNVLRFQGRYHRARGASVLTVSGDDFGDEIAIAYDDEGLENAAVGSRIGNPNASMTAVNAVSKAAYGQRDADDLSGVIVTTDAEVQGIVDWRANRYTQPAPRLPDVKIDLLTGSTAFQQAAQALDLSDRITPTSLPAYAPTMGDLIVEGWTEQVSDTEWSMALNASPWAPEQVWILGHATYGVLGSTTRLGYGATAG